MADFFKKIFGNKKEDNSKLVYWYLGGAYQSDYAKCSWNGCPCRGPEEIILRGQGYIYIYPVYPKGNFSANLTCEIGARLKKLNLEIARKDAQHWWNTGMVPNRETPTVE